MVPHAMHLHASEGVDFLGILNLHGVQRTMVTREGAKNVKRTVKTHVLKFASSRESHLRCFRDAKRDWLNWELPKANCWAMDCGAYPSHLHSGDPLTPTPPGLRPPPPPQEGRGQCVAIARGNPWMGFSMFRKTRLVLHPSLCSKGAGSKTLCLDQVLFTAFLYPVPPHFGHVVVPRGAFPVPLQTLHFSGGLKTSICLSP